MLSNLHSERFCHLVISLLLKPTPRQNSGEQDEIKKEEEKEDEETWKMKRKGRTAKEERRKRN